MGRLAARSAAVARPLAALLLATLLLAGCSDPDGSATNTTPAPPGQGSTAPTTPTTSSTEPAVTGSSTSEPSPTSGPGDGEGIGRAFFDAWTAGDEGGLAAHGSSGAVDAALAAAAAAGEPWAHSSCEGAAGSVFCSWVAPGQRVRLRVDNVVQPPQVVELDLAADLAAAEVAEELFLAWRAGSEDAIRALSQPGAAGEAIALAARAGEGWQVGQCEGAAGTVYCTWTTPGAELVIGVGNVEQPRLASSFAIEP